MKKFFLFKVFAFIGAIFGMAFGLLFAKKSGKELRHELSGTKNSKEAAKVIGQAVVSAGKASAEEIKKISKTPEVQKMIKKGKKKVSQMEKYIEKQGHKLIKKVETKINQVKKGTTKKSNKRKTSKTKK